jgi:hypothetical protein
MPTTDPRLQAAQAEDLQDLLNHIAWTDVILPQLTDLKSKFSSQLSQVLLNPNIPGAPTALQLAAKIQGIDFITTLFASILRQGASAIKQLEGTHWQITTNN